MQPLPQNLSELQRHNATAIKSTDANRLACVWQELDYHIEICHTTYGSHMYVNSYNLSELREFPPSNDVPHIFL